MPTHAHIDFKLVNNLIAPQTTRPSAKYIHALWSLCVSKRYHELDTQSPFAGYPERLSVQPWAD